MCVYAVSEFSDARRRHDRQRDQVLDHRKGDNLALPLSSETLAYLSLAFVFAITPGATSAVVIRHTIDGGRRRGLTAAAGAQVANVIQATLAIAGVSMLLSRWPGALKMIGIAGALFLAWIGIKSMYAAFRSAPRLRLRSGQGTERPFRDGFAVNVLNPSITSFYVGVVPTFVPPGATWRTFALFYAAHIAIAIACLVFWTSIFNHARAFFTAERPRRWLDAIVGIVLLALALRMASRM